MLFLIIKTFIEDCMSKRVKPLRAGRGRSRSGRDNYASDRDVTANSAYPFSEISSKLKVNVSGRAKRMALRLDPTKRVIHLVVPKRVSLKAAFEFAEENRDWIREKIRNLPRPVAFQDGEILPILGRDRRIVVLYNPALKFTDIQLKKDELLVLTNKLDPSARIRRYLIEFARERITEMTLEKAAQIRRKVAAVDVRDTRSRWGSCGEDGRICFSWRLIFAPVKALDYVVAHEVAHLIHMDHSDNFWNVCERLSRDYDTGKDWMRDHGHDLMRFGHE